MSRPRFFDIRFFAGFGAGIACTLLGIAIAGVLMVRSARDAAETLRVPDLPSTAALPDLGAAELVLRTLDGEAASVADLRGRTVLVNFWATWCAPCRLEMPTLQALHDDPPGDVVLLVASPEDAETVRSYVEAEGYTFPVYLYASQRPAPFDGEFLPTTYVVAPDGSVVFRHVGAADWNAPAVRAFLERLAT